MNERYLFRGKREKDEQWEYGAFWQNNSSIIDKSGYSQKVIPETVGQCTNKTDCKGKFIFSGDLLRFTDSDGEHSIYKVYYSDNYAGWAIQEVDCNGVDNMADWEINREYFEVIGNIHDNPELLEVER